MSKYILGNPESGRLPKISKCSQKWDHLGSLSFQTIPGNKFCEKSDPYHLKSFAQKYPNMSPEEMLGRIRMKIILNNPNLLFSKTNPPLFSNFFASIPLPRRKERILIVLTIGFSGETIFGFFFQFICCNKNSTRMDQMQVLGRYTFVDEQAWTKFTLCLTTVRVQFYGFLRCQQQNGATIFKPIYIQVK